VSKEDIMAYSISDAQFVYNSAKLCPDCLREGQVGSVVLSTWLPVLKRFHHSEWHGKSIKVLCLAHAEVLRDMDKAYTQMLRDNDACPHCTADPGNCSCGNEGIWDEEEYTPF